MKKYKLTKNKINFYGNKLYQIRALKDFAGVKAGQLGGYVQSERNLSQHGNCWIYNKGKALHDARLVDNSTIRHTAVASHNANMHNNSTMLRNSKLLGEASMFDKAIMTDNSMAFGFSEMKEESLLSDGACLSGNASSSRKALYIATELYDITISDNHIQIGVNIFSKKQWFNFTDLDIYKLEGKEGLNWWKKWKHIIFSMIEAELNKQANNKSEKELNIMARMQAS